MVESQSPALRRGRPRKSAAAAAGSSSIRSFLQPRVASPSQNAEQQQPISQEQPNLNQNGDEKLGGTDETDFNVPVKRKKKKEVGVVTESPKRESRKASKKQNVESPSGETKDCDSKKKKHGTVSESPKRVRASKRLVETQQTVKDDVEAELAAEIDQIDELRKEVRAAAEEYALLSAGRPVHPFFLKKPVEQQPGIQAESTVNPESYLFPASPFHVLQNTENSNAEPSWNGSVFKFAHQDSGCEFADDGLFRLISAGQHTFQTDSLLDCAELSKTSSANQQDSNKYTLHPCKTHSEQNTDTDETNRLWTDYYQPQCAQEVCGNSNAVALLNDWLRSWKEKVFMKASDILTPRLRMDDDDQGWFQEDGDAYDDEGDDGLDNTLLLTGPVGCGKSAAVYACANEQGFNVIEISASDNRSGAAIKQTVGEASESQSLKWSSLHPADQKMTMILFEEVDTVFEEDKGFVAALMKLAKVSKRPMILTSNCPQPLVPYTRQISFSKPAVKDLVAHAWMVCNSRGIFSGSSSLMKRIVESHEQDLRKLMMALQFWGQGRAPASTSVAAFNRSWTSQVYSDTQFRLLPQLVSVSFPCPLSKAVGERIASAVEEADILAAEAVAETAKGRAAQEAQAQRALRKQKMLLRRSMAGDAESLENSVLTPRTGRRKRLRKLKEVCDVRIEAVAGSQEREVTDCGPEANACRIEDLKVNACGCEDLGISEASAGVQHIVTNTLTLVSQEVTCSWTEDLAGLNSGVQQQVADKNEAGRLTRDPVEKVWSDLKNTETVCDCSLHASALKVVEALASTSGGLSSCDLISTRCVEDMPCSDIPTHLAHRYLQSTSEACCGLVSDCDTSYNPPWQEQQSRRTQRQKILEEEIFLTQSKLSRQCLTVSGFSDYVSLMARIVKLEELQKRDSLRPKHKRSRGYQEDYLSERYVSQPGIDALRELFVFDKTADRLTVD